MPSSDNQGHASAVHAIAACRLRLVAGTWDFARTQAEAIERHWQCRAAEAPALFNGTIHLLRSHQVAAGRLDGELLRTDFKSYLYWRETGFPEAGVRDGFGSALIRSAEGHVLLARQRGGNLNAGLVYPPGGFIDARDVGADGAVDIVASIARELAEETQLAVDALERQPGFIVTCAGPLVSIAATWSSALPAAELRQTILERLEGDIDSELDDIVIVRRTADLAGLNVAPFARALVAYVLG